VEIRNEIENGRWKTIMWRYKHRGCNDIGDFDRWLREVPLMYKSCQSIALNKEFHYIEVCIESYAYGRFEKKSYEKKDFELFKGGKMVF
jgi:hypothetical protein